MKNVEIRESMTSSLAQIVRARLSNLGRVIDGNKSLLMLLAANLMLRLPRVDGIIGDDAFVVLWMGRIVSEGYFEIWTLSPLSIFGMYPFAPYPVGIPLLLGVLFLFGASPEIAVFTLSMAVCIVGIAGSYYLGQTVFNDKEKSFFFAAFYSFSNVFMRFSYYTISARGPLLSVLPWTLALGIRFARQREPRYAIGCIISLLLLFLAHRLAVLSILYAFTFSLTLVIELVRKNVWLGQVISRFRQRTLRFCLWADSWKPKLKKLEQHDVDIKTYLFFAILTGSAYLIGLQVFNIDPQKTTPFILSNETLIGVTFNLIVDYWLRLGLLSSFLVVGIVISLHRDRGTRRQLVNLIIVPLMLFTIPLSLYSSVIFLPVFGYYSVVGLDTLWNSSFRKELLIGSMIGASAFGLTYHFIVVSLPTWILALLGILLSASVGVEVLSRTRKCRRQLLNGLNKYAGHALILSIIAFSLVTTDGSILQKEFSVMTEDEVLIISYLDDQASSGVTFVYDSVIGRRLEAYGHIAVRSYNEPMGFYLGWILSDEVVSNTPLVLDLELFIQKASFFSFEGEWPEFSLWNKLFGLDLTSQTDFAKARELGLKYVLVKKTAEGYRDTFELEYGEGFCPLLHSAPLACELVLDCQGMSLFELPGHA